MVLWSNMTLSPNLSESQHTITKKVPKAAEKLAIKSLVGNNKYWHQSAQPLILMKSRINYLKQINTNDAQCQSLQCLKVSFIAPSLMKKSSLVIPCTEASPDNFLSWFWKDF